MNRYQLAVRKSNPLPPRGEVCFERKDNEEYVRKCILFCMRNRLALNANNIPRGILDRAVIAVSKTTDAPVVVDTPEGAMALSSAYSHRSVFALTSSRSPKHAVIYYGPQNPQELKLGVNHPRLAVWVKK